MEYTVGHPMDWKPPKKDQKGKAHVELLGHIPT
jgi:hypothetical protein